MAFLCIPLHTLDFHLIYDPYQELAEKIYKWKVSKETKIEIAFENPVFSIDARLLLQFLRNDSILLRVKLLKAIIICHAHTFIVSVLIGMI